MANEYERKLSIGKKRSMHMKKLKESAMQGNLISRKLLRVVGSEVDAGSSDLENISCTGFLNKKPSSICNIEEK